MKKRKLPAQPDSGWVICFNWLVFKGHERETNKHRMADPGVVYKENTLLITIITNQKRYRWFVLYQSEPKAT